MLFAERLIELRKQKKLSRKAVACTLNIDPSTYGKYELRHRQPSLEMLDGLSVFFNVSVDYLLGKSDDPTPATERKAPVELTGEKEELLSLFDELTDDEKRQAINYVELLKRGRKE